MSNLAVLQPPVRLDLQGDGLPVHQPSMDLDADGARMSRAAKKIVALIPAGEVHDKTSVRAWTHADPEEDARTWYNSGDMFVYEASLRLLDFDAMEAIPLESSWSQRTVDRINAEASYCFVRGSNYIHPEMVWGDMLPLLDKLKVPIVAFGIGAQAPVYGPVEISADTRHFLEIVADRSKTIGVRGAFTAETINSLGIKNVEVIGCPSLMRHNRPRLDVRAADVADLRRVGFTLTRDLWPLYCQDVARARQLQRDIILDLDRRFDLTVMSQCETQERAFWYTGAGLIDWAIEALIADKWFHGPDDPMISVYRRCMFFGATPRAYEELVRGLDLVLGVRLHGNIMALANRIPAIYVVYDSRTRELVDYLGIPSYDIVDDEPFAIERFMTQERFDHFNARYEAAYARMARFLDANGIAHLMRP